MFIASSLCLILYILVFLRLQGYLVVEGWRIWFSSTSDDDSDSGKREIPNSQLHGIAKKMLLYVILNNCPTCGPNSSCLKISSELVQDHSCISPTGIVPDRLYDSCSPYRDDSVLGMDWTQGAFHQYHIVVSRLFRRVV